MALSLVNFTTILSLILSLFFLVALHPQTTLSVGENQEKNHILDFPTPTTRRSLETSIGSGCNLTRNICDGVSANNGASLLYCCRNHCRDTLSENRNCGKCGVICKSSETCCKGSCVSLVNDAQNCGQCGLRCPPEYECLFGLCELI